MDKEFIIRLNKLNIANHSCNSILEVSENCLALSTSKRRLKIDLISLQKTMGRKRPLIAEGF